MYKILARKIIHCELLSGNCLHVNPNLGRHGGGGGGGNLTPVGFPLITQKW